ncbi:MAG: flagellar type III secretion system protein FlhB [Gammaproteobacteria bacterium]|nr:flagellar type III secretion system protein FlhB [Gammaproteobacteria bacterium]
MAENDQERNEKPTGKRLEKAREEGQVPRSPELSAAAVLLVTAGSLHFFGGSLGASLYDIMRTGLSPSSAAALDPGIALSTASAQMLRALIACAPLLGLTMIAALVAPLALGGWNFSPAALAPNFTKLDPIAGFGRFFSARGAVELVKAFAKFLVVGVIAVAVLRKQSAQLLALGAAPLHAGIAQAASLSSDALLAVSAGLALIAAVDVPWQLWQHSKKLSMTREEIREEMKESEGAPEVKSRIRRTQREMARRRMMQEVPKADVVVVNPTHFAVALRYDESRMRAPLVVAKGMDLIAARIREVATAHAVPIFEAPPLARALHHNVEIGGEVPATLYVAVAQVLTYIYQLKAARTSGARPPEPPAIDPAIDAARH